MCLFFILPFSIPHGSISVLRETIIVVILLLFFIVFHYNPSLSVLGPKIITGHEAGLQQVAVKGFWVRVILLIPTSTTWTEYKTIALVCISNTDEFMHSINELDRALVSTVHPFLDHLHYSKSISKTITQHDKIITSYIESF